MKILLVAATPYELGPTLEHLEAHGTQLSFWETSYRGHTIVTLITGVGMMHTAFAMARYTAMPEVDIAINVGVAGAIDRSLDKGSVVEIIQDRLADLGVEEADGSFTDVYELGLASEHDAAISGGWVNNIPPITTNLRKVSGLTVNTVTGATSSIDRLTSKYVADVETMEGAAFLYACKTMDVKCLAIRGISNYVEPRDRAGWELEKAITSVNRACIDLLDSIEPL